MLASLIESVSVVSNTAGVYGAFLKHWDSRANRKYTNFKSREKNDHCEYLFFVERKNENEVEYESPLNYIGSKAKMISHL